MKFKKIYFEITNVCGLSCSFCPPKQAKNKNISLEEFEKVIQKIKNHTKIIALHIGGDPLVLSNILEYLEILNSYNLKAEITTSGYYLKNHNLKNLLHNGVKQINISLNSFNKNSMNISIESYLKYVLDLCRLKLDLKRDIFINLRLWNLNEAMCDASFNKNIINKLESFFKTTIILNDLNNKTSIRVEEKIMLNFDSYFSWPSLDSPIQSDSLCYGMKSHIGILSDATVVPCCLDKDGIIKLGNILESSLDEILNNELSTNIRSGFQQKKPYHELCKKCSYRIEKFL